MDKDKLATAREKRKGGVHHTVGVYYNGSYKENAVPDHELNDHVEYNTTFRFGRALFVNGLCVYSGSLKPEQCAAWEEKIKDWPTPPVRYSRH